ncbi:hypothetical protein [Microbacterium sp. VKM Ac-2923]|uniref:hypothetical protein n=1 Tax=Microbacterium sp. VKM Ac-2923 TaxID=2929476 RepID=UPI001FB4D3D3|nr:hypothetical protein [Microbacterium sp. VKM Ac-2923]MCJ1709245.1 hypothetical protein [Microbacterium sp. VKM Ac-2923]
MRLHLLHSWTPWEYTREYRWFAPFEHDYPAKVYRVYVRTCSTCGAPQSRRMAA